MVLGRCEALCVRARATSCLNALGAVNIAWTWTRQPGPISRKKYAFIVLDLICWKIAPTASIGNIGAFVRTREGSGPHFEPESPLLRYHLLSALMFDLQPNDLFTVGGTFFRQKRGVATGGLCSAQLAELYCIMCEYEAHRVGSHNHLWRRLSVYALQLCPYRFRDDIMGLVRDGVKLSRVQAIHEKLYCLDLQTEGEGLVLPSVEAQITVDPESRQIAIKLKKKVVWTQPPAKRIVYASPNPSQLEHRPQSPAVGLHMALRAPGMQLAPGMCLRTQCELPVSSKVSINSTNTLGRGPC